MNIVYLVTGFFKEILRNIRVASAKIPVLTQMISKSQIGAVETDITKIAISNQYRRRIDRLVEPSSERFSNVQTYLAAR